MLINVVGILTFVSKINDLIRWIKPENSIDSGYFDSCGQFKLSMKNILQPQGQVVVLLRCFFSGT